MVFINPIEILQLQNAPYAGSIDTDMIKREKRKLFAEIELSDNGLYHYSGLDITKSDCERVINELDNEEKKEFYYYLSSNPSLNNFLTTGNENLFNSFSQESIYKIPEFIAFINPFFSERFDNILLRAFKTNDPKLLISILRSQILINQPNINIAFKSVSNEIKNRIEEINKITEEIKNKEIECDEESIEEIVCGVKKAFPVELINNLPSYFQSQINKIGSTINSLDLAIDKEFGISISSMHLMEHLLKLNIESVGKKTFENNYQITKTRYTDKIEQEKNAPTLKKWASILSQIREITDSVDSKTIKPAAVIKTVNSIINISELNELPDFGNEVRNQIGYALRSLSISSWNAQKDIETALILINLSLTISVLPEAEEKFKSDLKDLTEIKQKREIQGKPVNSVPFMGTIYGIGFTIYNDTLYFVFLAIPIIPISRYNCSPSHNGYTFYGLLKLHKWQRIWQLSALAGILLRIIIAVAQSNNSPSYSNTETSYTPPSNSYTPPPASSTLIDNNSATTSVEPVYKVVSLKNGNIPHCTGFKSVYDYDINNKLIISADLTDAAVKIITYETDQCIRFIFIKDGTTYTVRNIPQGKYYLKIAYGNDWSVKEGDPICSGHFATKASYKKDMDLYDFTKKYHEDGNVSIPYYTLKLYRTFSIDNTTSGSTPNSITENDFFNN